MFQYVFGFDVSGVCVGRCGGNVIVWRTVSYKVSWHNETICAPASNMPLLFVNVLNIIIT